ncbi:MAG: preprotein translocase subunit SecA [Candidatus Gastranaerophilales bacterium]|nr:preprotein translocase subunit SecA [Candidatus Gastranaerophilales bacterium]
MISFLLKILGDPNDRKIKAVTPIVEHINKLEPEISALTDEQLRAKTDEFKEILNKRKKSDDKSLDYKLEQEALDELLPEAFAVVREAGKRVLNMRHFDVQLIGGYFLHKGQISEMRTGEGKTLVATLPCYLNALTGKGVHVVTVNDYLAKRDSEWMGRIYKFLGLSVGVILANNRSADDFVQKKNAYACDITYGTNNEFGFDYLRDNMAGSLEQCAQRPYYFAIIDEVDSILIDEARTPLIISGRLEKSAETYKVMAKIAPKLSAPVDYEIEEKNKNIVLNEEGIDKACEMLGVQDLYDPSTQYAHHLIQALRAKELFIRNTDYIVKDGDVMIVDEFTGRLMEGRRWSDGLHQAIEAKEGVKIQDETQTLASITFQNLFRLYPKLSGMTGTAITEEAEFGKIYNLEVTSIPTNQKDVRIDLPDAIYKTEKIKYDAVINEITENHKLKRPMLVGTVSIEKSEYISKLLKAKGLPHNVLNAKQHDKEAVIIAQAGRAGAITIATNMAGRGTDILLGGNPEFLAKTILDEKGITTESENYEEEKERVLQEAYDITQKEHDEVVAAGGLHVIGTERHESRRIDNQLRGRAARQGDNGSTKFYLSLEDTLMRIFGGEKIAMIMETLNIPDDMAIEAGIITKQIQSAQKKVETYHFDIRKQVIQYDDVMNRQREIFYKQRRKVLEGENLYSDISFMIEKEAQRTLYNYIDNNQALANIDNETLEHLKKALLSVFPPIDLSFLHDLSGMKLNELEERIVDEAKEAYKEHEKEIITFYNSFIKSDTDEDQQAGTKNNMMRSIERDILLKVIDDKWVDHLHSIDALKDGIGLRAYGQKDPLIEYKKEAFLLFNSMTSEIQRETVMFLFRTKFEMQMQQLLEAAPIETKLAKARDEFNASQNLGETLSTKKIGRNDPCPCGSGLKYKKCCGENKK